MVKTAICRWQEGSTAACGLTGINADEDLSDKRGGFVARGSYRLAGVVVERTSRTA
jgi:hypothetical protein